jgi:chemotaxis protein MotA
MDFLTVGGALLALLAILLGQMFEGGHIGSLINGPAFLIVFGGTLGAIMLQAPVDVFKRAANMAFWVVNPPRTMTGAIIQRVAHWSTIARREGLLGLEKVLDDEREPFIRKALQLLVDGREPTVIRATLEVDIDSKEQYDLSAARLFEAMGGYAPTIGILGAVMGLIHVMENLSEPSKLGAGIATAFVATIYGVGIANLILIPMGNKLKAIVLRQARQREMFMEGVIAIAEGENPRNIEAKLRGFGLP